MRLRAFRITNFRSIVDTGWCPFAEDGVTVLVGQNESGKTSILEALSKTFGGSNITEDDCRIEAPLPEIRLCVVTSAQEIAPGLEEGLDQNQLDALASFLNSNERELHILFRWERKTASNKATLERKIDIESDDLRSQLAAAAPSLIPPEEEPAKDQTPSASDEAARTEEQQPPEANAPPTSIPKKKPPPPPEQTTPPQADNEPTKEEIWVPPPVLTSESVATAVVSTAPLVALFDQASGLLPDRVDITQIEDRWTLAGNGAQAANNFLHAANIDLDELVRGDARTRENVLRRANAEVTADFLKFWKQTIGKTERLQLECSIEHYGPGPKGGQPHLVFWISDGHHKLYLKQRSHGVRWFISFYVQLKASEKIRERRIFLLDEPGANLHSRAQEDVLRLINQLSEHIPIVYSTHSPHLIEYEKAYRILAVQRDGEAGDSPTRVIHAHQLGAASRDTLSPLLVAMGADFSQQQVIRKENNVILEEMSGAYYFMSIWKLLGKKEEVHFIAATGATNVESSANMFLGWGLGFAVVLDDDQMGRSVYNRLKRNIFGDDEEAAKKNILKLPNCRGIEDIFSKNDFKKVVLNKEDAEIGEANSEYVKGPNVSKPVLAYRLWIKISCGEVKLQAFDNETQKKLRQVADLVASLSKSSE